MRADLALWLAARGVESHPLASAALALAERLDSGQDAAAAMSSAVGRLQSVMGELVVDAPQDVDRLDLLRVRVAAKRAGEWGLVEALSTDVIERLYAVHNLLERAR